MTGNGRCGRRGRKGDNIGAAIVVLAAMVTAANPSTADDGKLLWQQMPPEELARFQDYARRVIRADADHQGDLLKLWGRRQLPLIEYGIGLGDGDPSGAMPSLIWIVGQFKGGQDGQLNGPTAMDFDYQWRPVNEVPMIDAAVPSLDIYVSKEPLPDIGRIDIQHEAGLRREVVHRGYGCQMARWLRGSEIVKAVGTVEVGADQGVPIYDTTYGGPQSDGLTTKGMEGLCASRIVMFGLGLNFVDVTFTKRVDESVMLEGAPRSFAEPSPWTDQPLIELLYRSSLKPGSPKSDAIALIDGLTTDR